MSTPTTHAPRTVQVNDITVAVQEFGEGEPLLIINGTSQSLGFWTETALVWANRFRVITYDLRGMGLAGSLLHVGSYRWLPARHDDWVGAPVAHG